MAWRGWWWLALAVIVPDAGAQILPALPQASIDTTYPVMSGATINVAAGGNLQTAINNAHPGDTITLAAGATFTGQFDLPAKSGNGWIVIRTNATDSSLPAPGTRVTPAYAAVMPKIVSANDAPAIVTDPAAHHYRFVGIEITVGPAVTSNFGLVAFGDDVATSLSQVASNLILDRVYIHGTPTANLRRGVALNSASSAVIDSYIADVHEVGADSQAVAGWAGPGPFKIIDNYLEAAGENVLFGGSDPTITNLVPSDIEVRGNTMFKPVAWQTATWTVKNLFELKNAQRVLIDGNVFEHNWPAGQNGFSILFTVRNQDGSAPWSVVQDVTFTHNIVRHVAAGINILGTDDLQPSQQTKRILIRDNLLDDVNAANWGGSGRLFQILDGAADITINHNTGFQSGEIIVASGAPNTGFTYINNLTPHNQYGVAGDNFYGNPAGALTTYFPGCVFRRNVLQGGKASNYPADNFFPAAMTDVKFVDQAGGNYRLQAASPYHAAGTDGLDVGVDMDSLDAATTAVIDTPSLFTATATSNSEVALSWLPVSGATGYEVYRWNVVNGTPALALSTTATSGPDDGRSADTTYVYRVRALRNTAASAFSPIDVATTVVFTDASLTGQRIRDYHITQLRTAVNAMRVAANLTPMTFTDTPVTGALVKRVHVTELRAALDAARSALGLSGIAYTDSAITAKSTAVKATHIVQLRSGTQ